MKCFRPLFILLCVFCASAPLWAQPRKATPKSPVKSAPTFPVLPVTMGLGGLVLGAALSSLGKPRAVEAKTDTLSTLFDEVPLALALVSEKEKITRANTAFGRFFEVGATGNAHFPEIFHPDDLTQVRVLFQEVLDGDRAGFSLPARFFGRDGAPFHALLEVRKQGQARKPDAVLIALQDISAQIEAQRELDGAREAIRALYEVIAGNSGDLSGKMRALLAMGCGRFELPIGALGRFEGPGLETLFVQSSDRRVRPALTVLRGDRTSEAELLGAQHWPTPQNWEQCPFVARNEGGAYLAAPVLVGGELFGILSFSSFSPRDKPFGDDDAQLLQLMVEWVGGEIERDQARIALENQQRDLLQANAQLEALATHDALTGAKNRRAFDEKLAEEWSRATRYATPLSLILLDVDKFKSYNDTFGHPAGDEVLKRVARIVLAMVRGTDFFARYGGEEFVLLLPNTDAQGAMILAERLRQKIEGAPWKERPITASFGVSNLQSEFKSAAELTQSADDALYDSKENGRNRVTHARDKVALAVKSIESSGE